RRHRRLPLQAHRRAGRRARAPLRPRTGARADRTRQSGCACRRGAGLPGDADFRGGEMIGKAQGPPISITGLGAYAPKRVLSNDELATLVDTSDEWIMARTGIRDRGIAAPEEALTDLALPAANTALEQAGVEGKDIDLL